MKKQLITVENQCSPHVISALELDDITAAIQLQARMDFNYSPWVEHGYCDLIEVLSYNIAVPTSKSTPPPAGTWNIIFIDDKETEGDLGWHEDITGTKIPVSYVAVREVREDNVALSEVASHEMIEMAVDPFVENEIEIRTVIHENKEYIIEPCDPVQGQPYYRANQLVSDYCWPRYYNLPQARLNLSQRNSIKKQFELGPEGYYSYKEPDGEWKQVFGEKRTKLPKWASRLPRAGAA